MHCSTRPEILVVPPRLPHTLVLLLIISLLMQTYSLATPTPLWLPLPPTMQARWYRRARPVRSRHSPRVLHGLGLWRHAIPRRLVRAVLLAVLLHTSGWTQLTPLGWVVLLLPVSQLCAVSLALASPHAVPSRPHLAWAARLQRLYQLTCGVLVLSSLAQLLSRIHVAPGSLFFPLLVGGWVLRPDEATEISVTPTAENHYTVTLRGAFTLLWEPRDAFERALLIVFLRKLQRPGQTHPLLLQRQVAQACGTTQTQVSHWERDVRERGWHVLSDRFRHQLHSALPDAELSRQILHLWVPAFWLSAWELRERLIQLGIIADRDALAMEDLHLLAKHTGFNQVRDLLLERFELQNGRLLAEEHWWLKQLLALNERLLAKLQQGERLTPQETIEIEPLRLNPSAKAVDSAPPPLAATRHRVLFEPPTETSDAPVRCTYCDSDHIAPKSKQPRLKTVLDEFGAAHLIQVLRYYCHNPACPFQTFTHFPTGVLPHSHFPAHVRLLAVEVYVQLLSTYRRSARMLDVKASTVYGWLASVSPATLGLAAYLGVVRTSGVVGIDDKWIKVCSPSAVPKHGRRPHAVWRYAYFAVDLYSYDLLALELYPEHNDAAVRLLLLELKAKGICPRVVVSDLDPAYGRMLPQVFPQTVHHECIFHAIQNAQRQLTTVYGRHYVEHVPAAAALHEAIVNLFQAQTQKTVRQRFTELMTLRESYVKQTPAVVCVFDSLERHFPKLVNAIESSLIPRTNNVTERVIRRFDQHYHTMCGLDSFHSARVYLRLFELVYRLTPFTDDSTISKRGKCPLELAGYDLKALPIADFFINLKLPTLALPAPEVVPMG